MIGLKAGLAIGGLAALGALAAHPFMPLNKADLQSQVLNATVRVEFVKGRGSGSGTAISARRILTNHHVIQHLRDEDTIRVRGWVREGNRVLPVVYHATVIAQDEANDLALLELDADWIGATATLARSEPPEATEVCKSGSPMGKRPQVTCGLAAGRDSQILGGMRHYVHNASTVPGDSGGGVWSAHFGAYRLVAVTRAIPTIPAGFMATPVTTMGLAVPLDAVRTFIAESEHASAAAD